MYIDKIYDHVIHVMFENPGVSLVELEVETRGSDALWSIDRRALSTIPVDPVAHERSLDVLYSLYLLRNYELNLSDRQVCEIRLEYVCMTSLGIEFIIKCDHETQEICSASDDLR
jgi:hypothetical protein